MRAETDDASQVLSAIIRTVLGVQNVSPQQPAALEDQSGALSTSGKETILRIMAKVRGLAMKQPKLYQQVRRTALAHPPYPLL